MQRRIFIFGALGYFKLGVLLEGSRQGRTQSVFFGGFEFSNIWLSSLKTVSLL